MIAILTGIAWAGAGGGRFDLQASLVQLGIALLLTAGVH
jgi:hypothetical protein